MWSSCEERTWLERGNGMKMNSRLYACIGKTVSGKVFPKCYEKKATWTLQKKKKKHKWDDNK